MATRRKPVPPVLPSEHTNHSSQSAPADSRITRYSLTDDPLPPHPSNDLEPPNTYDSINQAVDQLLHESYADGNQHNLTQDARSIFGQERSISRQGSSSEGTVVDPNEHPSEIQQPPMEYQPYQLGQYLAPIITGETLQLGDCQQPIPIPNPDPFADSQILIEPVAHNYDYYDQDYTPPSPRSYDASYDAEILPAGSDGLVDHFNYDTEAYASGNYSRASFRPPRSRSPTPAVDNEDYYIVGNDSIHYTAYPDTQHIYDPEKATLQQQQQHPDLLNAQYADYGQTLSYEPDQKTPASLNYSEPETPVETRHFGPAPTGRVLRRHKSKKRVQLTNGNLVVDLNVPPKLVLPRRGEPETMQTRYTAVTCDPDEFEKKGFFLRQNEIRRRTELFIVITMFNVRTRNFF